LDLKHPMMYSLGNKKLHLLVEFRSAYNDYKFSNIKWSNEMFRRIYSIEAFSEIGSRIQINYADYYKILWKQIGFYPQMNHSNYIGQFSNYKKSDLAGYKSAIDNHYYKNNKKLDVSNTAVSYLDSIITICKNHNITTVLVSNPVHIKYLNEIPAEIMTTYRLLKEKYDTQAIIIDKTEQYYPDSLFLNADHLNWYGATVFTKDVRNILYAKTI
jgi:hypothetical protein